MNCCDEYGDCNQGRDCPVRKGYSTRRCKAGQPVTDDMPVQYWPGTEEENQAEREAIDTVNVAIVLAIISIMAVILIGVVLA